MFFYFLAKSKTSDSPVPTKFRLLQSTWSRLDEQNPVSYFQIYVHQTKTLYKQNVSEVTFMLNRNYISSIRSTCLFHDMYFKSVPWLLHEKIEVFTHSVAVTHWHLFKGGWGHFYTVTCFLKHCQCEFCSWTDSDNASNCNMEYPSIRS